MSSPESKKQKFHLGVQGRFALLIVVVMLALALFGEKGVLRAYKLSQEKHSLEAKIQSLQKNNEALREEINLLRSDLEYIEDVARRDLGMVKDDELVYQFSPESSPPPDADEKTPPKK